MHSFDDVPQPTRYTFDPTEPFIEDVEHAENLLELADVRTRIQNLQMRYLSGFSMTSWDYEYDLKMLKHAECYFEHRVDTYNRQRLMHAGKGAIDRLIRDLTK